MAQVTYDDLSEELQLKIAALEIKVMDLEYEANFYRFATAIAVVIAIERIWDRFF